MSSDGSGERLGGLEPLCWAFAIAALLYAFAIHHGIGPLPGGQLAWYKPRAFLFGHGWLQWAMEPTRRLMLVFTAPALALAVAVFLTGRSAVARALSVSALFATVLFLFYGDVATRVWEFFHWRGSAVLTLIALFVGFAACAPLLAASWLRLGWGLRLAVYLPVLFVVLAFIRNATGTDLKLRFAISPWPAIPVFGLEVGALFVMIWLLGAAIGVAGISLGREREGQSRILMIVGGILLGISVPALLLALGSSLKMLPFRAAAGTYTTVVVFCAIAIALTSTLGLRGRAGALRERALHLAVGAALVAIPLVAGQAWARWDYYYTREHRAYEIIDAMEEYAAKEDMYPDELDELVTGGYLGAIPEPSIGFGFLYDGSFRYRSFGTSYILEFPAPRWVECAYSPPYEEEEGEDEELEAWEVGHDPMPEGDDGSLDEAWSCPSQPPELW